MNTVPGPQTTNENTALVFSSANGNGITVCDLAAGNNPHQETLRVSNGTLTLNGTTGLTFTCGTGAGDARMTFTGTIANINNALNGLSFQPTSNYFGAASVQIASTDYTGSGGPQTATNTVNATINHVNAIPTITVPGTQTTGAANIAFSSGSGNLIAIADAAAGNSPLQVTLAAQNGAITLSSTAGLTFTAGTGAGDATMTFTGCAAEYQRRFERREPQFVVHDRAITDHGERSIGPGGSQNRNGRGGHSADAAAGAVTVAAGATAFGTRPGADPAGAAGAAVAAGSAGQPHAPGSAAARVAHLPRIRLLRRRNGRPLRRRACPRRIPR